MQQKDENKIDMSEFKGTKGKWKIKEKGATILDDNDNSVICWYGVATSTFWKKEEEFKANSLLISKAPEMLEMLEKLAHGEHYIGVQEIRQLIKEATEI